MQAPCLPYYLQGSKLYAISPGAVLAWRLACPGLVCHAPRWGFCRYAAVDVVDMVDSVVQAPLAPLTNDK